MSVSPRTARLFREVEDVHDRMERLLALPEARLTTRSERVSAWSSGQHLVHGALSAASMLVAVDRIVHQASPAAPNGGPSATGRLVLLAGRFPRGRAKAPERTLPPENPGRLEGAGAVARSRLALARVKGELPRVDEATWKLEHPTFGWLDARQWLRVVCIHSEHHFAIIDDILSAG